MRCLVPQAAVEESTGGPVFPSLDPDAQALRDVTTATGDCLLTE